MVLDAGSGGRYAGRSSATRSFNTVIPRVQPIRSAITVAGIVGTSANNSRILGSNPSTADPCGDRTYLGGPSDPIADLTVFLEIPNRRAIALIAIPSARCNRRISAQSSTLNTPHDPLDSNESRVSHGGQDSGGDTGSAFNRRRQHSPQPDGLTSVGKHESLPPDHTYGTRSAMPHHSNRPGLWARLVDSGLFEAALAGLLGVFAATIHLSSGPTWQPLVLDLAACVAAATSGKAAARRRGGLSRPS